MSSSIDSSSAHLASYQELMNFFPFPTVIVEGPLYAIRVANPAFCHLLGKAESSLSGQNAMECLAEFPAGIALLVRVSASGHPEQHVEEEPPGQWSYAAWPVLIKDRSPLLMLQITETSELHRRATLMNEALLVSAVKQHERVDVVTASAERMNVALVQQDEELDRTKEELRSLALQLLQAQEEERRRIARELHDSFAQQLASLGMQVFQLEKEVKGEAGQSLIAHVQTQLGKLASEIRALSHQLHPPTLEDLGLTSSLRGLLAELEVVHSIATRLVAGATEIPLPLDVATALFRIVQESLWNVVKHAGEDALVTVTLLHEGDRVVLCIEDSGVGFDSAVTRGNGGLGLISIQERARLVGGTAKVDALPGAGTRISVHVPLTGSKADSRT